MYVLKYILLTLFIATPISAEALTELEIKKVWHRYAEKLKDAGIACIYTKAELADMFAKMDASFPKAEPEKVFVADRIKITTTEENGLNALLPDAYKDRFFADERTNTRVLNRKQIVRKMKLLAVESLNEIRSPRPTVEGHKPGGIVN